MTERDPYLDGIMKKVPKEMTEPTPITDAVWENTPGPATNILNEMRECSMRLERSLARKEALLRWLVEYGATEDWEDLIERIERELEEK